MCGVAGFLAPGGCGPADAAGRLLTEMGQSLRHRGPDASGDWLDPAQGIGLTHRRLSIVELSVAGAQPMESASGRYVIVYNGEIYNHLELRCQLDDACSGLNWRGQSDTETLLAAVDAWGVCEALRRTTGMFALALWDRQEHTLTLARDRIGEKPLYYGWQCSGGQRVFLFGSELKALARHPSFQDEIDRDALALFMRYGYIAGPFSIYRGIAKLRPGTYLTLSAERTDAQPVAYWSAAKAVRNGIADPIRGSPDEALDELEAVLLDAVRKQMMSDVPLGAFLSGGVDSSTVVSLMQAQSAAPVKTFSIGFSEEGFNEAEYAKAVAGHLGSDHTELYVTPDDALAVIPRLPAIYDEPFADSSQIPTFLVSQLARRHVTVALSGDAGDELFGGYDRYYLAERNWKRIRGLPLPARRAAGAALCLLPRGVVNRFGRLAGIRPSSRKTAGDLLHKAAGLVGARSPAALSVAIGHRWPAEGIVDHGSEPETLLTAARADHGRSPVDAMMAVDLDTYLPDDILVKVDRAAMAVSLETRMPFLDHRVVEYAWRLPLELKRRPGETKVALRRLLARRIPRELIERPKMGFSVPIHSWLRGPLRDWAESLLNERRVAGEGYFRPGPLRNAWAAHQSGEANMQSELWAALMFQAWLAEKRAPERFRERGLARRVSRATGARTAGKRVQP